MAKPISLIAAFCMLAVSAIPAFSLAETPNAIVHDARSNPIKDIRGNCVRTLYGNQDEECGIAPVIPVPVAQKEHTRLASVYFDFNKADLNKRARITLDRLLADLRDKKINAVTIAGYADAIGSDSYNLQLSKKRAEAVKGYLNRHGFAHTDTDLRALGKRDADKSCKGKKDGSLHACMQEDRRVDIELSVTR